MFNHFDGTCSCGVSCWDWGAMQREVLQRKHKFILFLNKKFNSFTFSDCSSIKAFASLHQEHFPL